MTQIMPSAGLSALRNCLICDASIAAKITWGLRGLPHDADGHDVVYEYHELSQCGACGHGQLEIHSHDCWSHEEPDNLYWYYVFSPADCAVLLNGAAGICSTPLNPHCACAWHQQVRALLSRLMPMAPSAVRPRRPLGFRRVALMQRDGALLAAPGPDVEVAAKG